MDGISAPNPSYEILVKNVTGNVITKKQNKNLFDKDGEVTRYYINNAGQEVIGVGEDTFIKTLITDNIASSYVISYKTRIGTTPYVRFSFFNGDTFISRTLLTNNNTNVIVPANTTKIDIRTDILETKHFEDLQIEAGTTATDFVEHKEQNLPFTLEPGQRMYKDSYLTNGIHNKRKQVVLNGSENWAYYDQPGGVVVRRFILVFDDIKISNTDNGTKLMSNMFKQGDYLRDNNFMYIPANRNFVWFGSTITENMTVTQFKEFLATKNLIFEYETEEEEIIPYNETQATQYNDMEKAKAYEGQTIIYGESDEAEPNYKVKYYMKGE